MSCLLARRVNPHVSLAPQLTRHDAHVEYRGYRSIVDVWLVVASFALIALIGPGLFEELLEARIEDAETVAAGLPESVVISAADLSAHVNQVVEKWKWHARPPHVEAAYDAALVAELAGWGCRSRWSRRRVRRPGRCRRG